MSYAEQMELEGCEEEWPTQLARYQWLLEAGRICGSIDHVRRTHITCRKAACVTVPLVAILSDIIKHNTKEQYQDLLVYDPEGAGTDPETRQSWSMLRSP